MKLVGIVVIISAAVMLGILRIRERKKRIDGLGEIINSLYIVRMELETNTSPLENCIKVARKHSGNVCEDFYSTVLNGFISLGTTDFDSVWSEAALNNLNFLKDNEIICLSDLGAILGKYPASEQSDAINECICRLKQFLEGERSEYREKSRMELILPCSAALILTILLL